MSSPGTGTIRLNGVSVIRSYIDKIVNNEKCTRGTMKVLLLDAATTQIVSAVYSQTEILNQQVYLVSSIDKASSAAAAGENKSHMHAVCFLRPTPANVDALCAALQHPQYTAYHVFFSGFLPTGLLRKIAEADATHEKVVQLQEYYADFLPANEDLWTLQCRHTLPMTVAAGTSWAPKHAVQYERNLQGLQAMLLSLKRRPAAIRYAAHSPCAEELAKDLHDSILADDIFHFRRDQGLLLLVLDRRDDPVTPLLSQWTYQAMVHELLGLNNHRVVLKGAPGIAKDLEEVVLSAASDEFFANNRHKNFGELGEEIQRMLKDYQKQTAHHTAENLNSIEEMQQFMDKYPELRSRSHTVSKHVAIMGELSRLVEACSLMDVSQFEQSLACSDDHSAHWRELLEKLNSPRIMRPDKLRLGLLYALRYEASANLHMVQQAMSKGGVPPDMVKLLPVMLRYGGSKARGPGLFGEQHNLMSRMTKNFVGAVQGIDNVYTQHVPLLMDTLQSAVRGKLSPREYPVVQGSTASRDPVQHTEILVFMVGGVTYEEGTKICDFNAQNKGRVQVVLAGSTIHNSTSFLDELKATALG
jgi:vacuolar protein sorting-associated protein 45